MAKTELRGCAAAGDQLGRLKQSKTNTNQKTTVNENGNPTRNGYHKTQNLQNGTSSSSMSENEEPIPMMDWSQYDTYSGAVEKCLLVVAALTHIGLYILMFLGFVNQLLFKPKVATEKNREGYAPLYNPFDQFFSRYLYRRVRHCFNRPICSAPGAEIVLKERLTDDYNWSFRLSGRELRCINLGSYNYLGFAEGADGGEGGVTSQVEAATRRYGLAVASSRNELGTTPLHVELERTVADFLGVEDAIVVGMGFATNALLLPGLLSRDDLVLSDEKNHASLILGLRLAGVKVKLFPHNNLVQLERIARKAIQDGKWRKIVIVVEGIYSMEGSIVPLKALVALKQRYGLSLYLDEAHSIGALGSRGRGVCDYHGVKPQDVDVLMGTFTKSFGAAGGYIAGSKKLVNHIRLHGHAACYAHAMAPCVAAQTLAAARALAGRSAGGVVAGPGGAVAGPGGAVAGPGGAVAGPGGAVAGPGGAVAGPGGARLEALRDNTRHFRQKLRSMGGTVLGHHASPVVPLLVYTFSNMAAVVERLAAAGVAVVGVGFPATPLGMARIRFCLSAAHTREQLDRCLSAIHDVITELGLDYGAAIDSAAIDTAAIDTAAIDTAAIDTAAITAPSNDNEHS